MSELAFGALPGSLLRTGRGIHRQAFDRPVWDYTKKDGTKSCWDRPGAGFGETELNRLFYRLGWTKGWYKGELRNKIFGEITGETNREWKTIKNKLLEMAKKYDQAA